MEVLTLEHKLDTSEMTRVDSCYDGVDIRDTDTKIWLGTHCDDINATNRGLDISGAIRELSLDFFLDQMELCKNKYYLTSDNNIYTELKLFGSDSDKGHLPIIIK